MTTERPILFSGSMVRAILEGRKTQTRRIYKSRGKFPYRDGEITANPSETSEWIEWGPCPYGVPGDRLWVRETWRIAGWNEGEPLLIEYADGSTMEDRTGEFDYDDDRFVEYWIQCAEDCKKSGLILDEDGQYRFDSRGCITRWRPSIHMPRWASRITLEVTGVRVERVQKISEEDATAEGFDPMFFQQQGDSETYDSARECFASLWDFINAKRGYGWDKNPLVWVAEFRQVIQ